MKLIKANFEIIEQGPGLTGMYKAIESAGRTCYQSWDKVTEDSAKKFVDMLTKLGHGAMLEHGTVYLDITDPEDVVFCKCKYGENKYSKVYITTLETKPHLYVTSNMRVLVENKWLEDLKYLCEPTKYHEKRICVRFVLPIGISREFCRHRSMSFAEMSTRYCNLSKNRFGNEITCILPHGFNAPEGHIDKDAVVSLCDGEEDPLAQIVGNYIDCEKRYMNLINAGCAPQIARDVLPLGLKSELVMTGFVSDWKHFFELRADSHAHPQARALAEPLREEFIKRNYIN